MTTELSEDWHPAWIKFKLETVAKTSLRKLSTSAKLSPDSLKKVLRKPWPDAELIVAQAIGVNPWDIWPSRYLEKVPKSGRLKARNNAGSE